nr:immunoglobulin light chain junction region [Macaca mulatta]
DYYCALYLGSGISSF